MVTPVSLLLPSSGSVPLPSSNHLATTRTVSTRDREHNERIFLNDLDIIIGKRPIRCLAKKPTPVYPRML
jgi:hypothetical protein